MLFSSLKNIPKYKSDMNFKSKALIKVSRTIEYHCGRMRPFIYNVETFKAFETLITDYIQKFPHFDENNFIKHEERLVRKIKEEIFTEQDEEKIIIKTKRKKPTKFERNDKRRDEMLKLKDIKKLTEFLYERNLLDVKFINFEDKERKLKSTPLNSNDDAETDIYDS